MTRFGVGDDWRVTLCEKWKWIADLRVRKTLFPSATVASPFVLPSSIKDREVTSLRCTSLVHRDGRDKGGGGHYYCAAELSAEQGSAPSYVLCFSLSVCFGATCSIFDSCFASTVLDVRICYVQQFAQYIRPINRIALRCPTTAVISTVGKRDTYHT